MNDINDILMRNVVGFLVQNRYQFSLLFGHITIKLKQQNHMMIIFNVKKIHEWNISATVYFSIHFKATINETSIKEVQLIQQLQWNSMKYSHNL